MDWDLAIKRNGEALQRVVAALFALAGLAEGAVAATLPRAVYRAVLSVLRPAESAVRRLIIIAARGLVLKARPVRAFPEGLSLQRRSGGMRAPVFCLVDPLKKTAPGGWDQEDVDSEGSESEDLNSEGLDPGDWGPEDPSDEVVHHDAGAMPRIRSVGSFEPLFLAVPPVQPDEDEGQDQDGAARLLRRLLALKRALDNLPGQARRLARWRARRDVVLQGLAPAAKAPPKRFRLSPFRPGLPPGHRDRHIHEIDAILRECHGLARYACEQPNTS
jgi:hypothetical protein